MILVWLVIVCERSAIEARFETCGDVILLSVTRTIVSLKLHPALQHRSVIESLVEKEIIVGELAQQWNQRCGMENLLKQKVCVSCCRSAVVA